jgi:hypothetical protein
MGSGLTNRPVRPGELRKAEWFEFNFETAEWRIPAAFSNTSYYSSIFSGSDNIYLG